jgi:hypothetical protein
MNDALDLIQLAVDLAFVGVFAWAGLFALLGGQNQTSPGDTMPDRRRNESD